MQRQIGPGSSQAQTRLSAGPPSTLAFGPGTAQRPFRDRPQCPSVNGGLRSVESTHDAPAFTSGGQRESSHGQYAEVDRQENRPLTHSHWRLLQFGRPLVAGAAYVQGAASAHVPSKTFMSTGAGGQVVTSTRLRPPQSTIAIVDAMIPVTARTRTTRATGDAVLSPSVRAGSARRCMPDTMPEFNRARATCGIACTNSTSRSARSSIHLSITAHERIAFDIA